MEAITKQSNNLLAKGITLQLYGESIVAIESSTAQQSEGQVGFTRVKPIHVPRVKPTQQVVVRTPLKQMPHAISNFLQAWQMNVPENQHNPQAFLANTHPQIHHKLVEKILSLNGVKFQLAVMARVHKQTLGGLYEWKEPTLRNKMEPFLTANKIPEALDKEYQHILKTLKWFTNKGSRQIVDHVVRFQLHIACYQPLHGGSHLPLPREVQIKSL